LIASEANSPSNLVCRPEQAVFILFDQARAIGDGYVAAYLQLNKCTRVFYVLPGIIPPRLPHYGTNKLIRYECHNILVRFCKILDVYIVQIY